MEIQYKYFRPRRSVYQWLQPWIYHVYPCLPPDYPSKQGIQVFRVPQGVILAPLFIFLKQNNSKNEKYFRKFRSIEIFFTLFSNEIK